MGEARRPWGESSTEKRRWPDGRPRCGCGRGASSSNKYGGETLSSYDVQLSREPGKPTAVGDTRLFETSYVRPRLRLFAVEEAGWLKAPKLEGYAPRRPCGRMVLQDVLFPYLDAL